jgi:ABC-type phosphate transport system substrate-binding protein
MNTRILVLLFAFSTLATPQQSFSVVVNKDNPAQSISKVQLRKMILGETSSWPGGAKVVVLLGPTGDNARAAGLKAICGMTESDFSKHALEASFAGGAKEGVKTLPSNAAVRTVVGLTPGGVGIVDGSEAGPGSRLLSIQ